MNICNLTFHCHLVCNDMTFKYVCLTTRNWDYSTILIMGLIWFLVYTRVWVTGSLNDSLIWNMYIVQLLPSRQKRFSLLWIHWQILKYKYLISRQDILFYSGYSDYHEMVSFYFPICHYLYIISYLVIWYSFKNMLHLHLSQSTVSVKEPLSSP